MQPLSVYLVQADLVWENAEENIRHLDHLLQGIPDGALVLLPEMFATGFSMNPARVAQDSNGPAIDWLKRISAGKAVCGSLSFKENGKYYNRLIWAENGEVRAVYDKKHLFSYGKEQRFYESGTERICVDYRGWKILPFVCYDLRFPVWCRNTEEAELMLFVANWPQVRIKAWEKLLQARAIENQCYVAGVNRVGEDGNGVYHNGSSMVCDARGEILAHKTDEEAVICIDLDPNSLMEFRQSFPVLKDRDGFEFRV